MKASQRIRQFIKAKEALSLKAYPDPKTGGAPWTIAYGHTKGVLPGDTTTLEQAEKWFDADLEEFEGYVDYYVKVPLTQGQYDALVSIFFNVGPGSGRRDGIGRLKNGDPSTLLRKLNAGDYKGARAEFPRWCSPGSDVERGLRIRRNDEVRNFWDAPELDTP